MRGKLTKRGPSGLPKMECKTGGKQGRGQWQGCCVNGKVDCSRKGLID